MALTSPISYFSCWFHWACSYFKECFYMSVVKKNHKPKQKTPLLLCSQNKVCPWCCSVLGAHLCYLNCHWEENPENSWASTMACVPPLIPCWGTVWLPSLVLFLVGPWLQLDSGFSLRLCAGYSGPAWADQHKFAIKEKTPQKSHPKQSCSLGGKFEIQAANEGLDIPGIKPVDKSLCSRAWCWFGEILVKLWGRAALLTLQVEVLLFRDGVIDLNEW